MPFVIVPTNPRINHIGCIFGPFDTREDAQTAIEKMNFPTPEDVLIRPFAAPTNCEGEFELPLESKAKCFKCELELQQHEWYESIRELSPIAV